MARALWRRPSEALQDLGKEIEAPKPGASGAKSTPQSPITKPIPVEVRQPEATRCKTFAALITPLVHRLAITGIVVIFVIFIPFQREDLRNH